MSGEKQRSSKRPAGCFWVLGGRTPLAETHPVRSWQGWARPRLQQSGVLTPGAGSVKTHAPALEYAPTLQMATATAVFPFTSLFSFFPPQFHFLPLLFLSFPFPLLSFFCLPFALGQAKGKRKGTKGLFAGLKFLRPLFRIGFLVVQV